MADLSGMTTEQLLQIYQQEKAKAQGPKAAPQWGPGAQEMPDGSIVRIGPRGGATVLQKAPRQAQSVLDPIPNPERFRTGRDLLGKVDSVRDRAGFWSTGPVGNFLSGIPGTWAYDLDKDADTVRANLAFQELAAMRAASPTGGALGSITERELDMLRNTQANMDIGQSTGQFKNNVASIRRRALEATPGISVENPIELPPGVTPGKLPKGAFYMDAQGNVRRNDNGDKGNPILKAAKSMAKEAGLTGMSDDALKKALGL